MIGITGVPGGIGGRVARRISEHGLPQRLIVRDPSRAPELPGAEVAPPASYQDRQSMRVACDGVDTLLLVSAPEAIDRLDQHRTAVDAAVDAGVRRIVYTSFLNASPTATFVLARQHFHTEEHIKAHGLRHTFLRDSLYQDGMPYWVREDDTIRAPAGEERVSAVARDDVADVAVVALLDEDHDGQTYDVTGPEALNLDEIAAELSTALERNITYVPETEEAAYESRSAYGAPDWEVEGWVTSFQAIAAGEMATVTDHVEQLTGHPPMSLAEFLAAYPPG